MPLSKVVSNSLSLTTLTSSGAGSIQGLTVGRGAGAVATNTAVGASALVSNTTGANGTAVGYQAGYSNTTASDQTFVGFEAGYAVTGANNTGFGRGALRNATTTSGSVALGRLCMGGGTVTGADNTGVGNSCLQALTSGGAITAVGSQALISNTTGSYNTAVGYQASYTGTTGERNTNLGYQAGYTPTTASESTFVGYKAGYAKTTGDACTFIGNIAGTAVTTGATNTFVGSSSGSTMTTGSQNTILGSYNGNQGGLDIRTSSNNIVLSDGAGNVRLRFSSDGSAFTYYSGINGVRQIYKPTFFGYSSTYTVLMLGLTSGNQSVAIGYDPVNNPSGGFNGGGSETLFRRGMQFITPNSADTSFYVQFTMTDGVTSGDFNDTSDVALKENIQPIETAWNTIKALRPITFDWKQEGKGSRSGFIAQEVELYLPNDVLGENYVAPNPVEGVQGTAGKAINTTGIVAHLTKALQEAMARIEQLEADVTALKGHA